MTFTGLGMAIGLAGAVVASQAIAAMLFRVSRLDPVTYVIVIVLLTGVSLMACVVTTRRASRIDPLSSLRQE